jgi:DNA invertase Pin-like site-specific DNA recombinase
LQLEFDSSPNSSSDRDSDSTLHAVYGIDSTYMKKAALYARVSGDLQAKEGTIESQVLALKKQIATAGHVLVKEYIDNGFSGPRFDRPALNEMRKDVKTDLFDVIYFHDADRIAREVTIQTIIIEEILKHRKQLIINGKDYVKNPENKFTLTVLGAVAELERAKIIERVTRGKQLRLAQGQLLGCGHTFGYDYVRKSPTSRPQMIINEREAELVRYMFETYASKQIGLDRIAKRLEDMGAITKTGKKLWRRSFLKTVLCNETYLGVKYFNTMRIIREYANPIYDIKHSTKKTIKRGREDWIGVEVPAIISRELFDRVQERLKDNRKRYRNPKQTQLLSTLVRCGCCGGSVYAYRRWVRSKRKGPPCVRHSVAYKCNWRFRQQLHSSNSQIERCTSREIKGGLLEGRVLAMVKETMLDPTRLRACMDFFREDAAEAELRLENELKAIAGRLAALQEQKRRIVDLYASGDLSRDGYVAKNRELDGLIETLKARNEELADNTALLRKTGAIDTAIAQYCEGARMRFQRCTDPASMRQFMLHYVEKVVHLNGKVSLHGQVPVKYGQGSDLETNALPFCIESEITREERYRDRMQTAEALSYQQSMALLREQSANVVPRAL